MSTILLIDDDETVLVVLKGILDQAGYDTRIAQNAKQALVLIKSNPPDLIITDIFMPDIDGFDLIARLRSGMDYVPIVAISGGGPGSGGRDYLTTIKDIGADEYLEKPISKQTLLATVASVLGNRPAV